MSQGGKRACVFCGAGLATDAVECPECGEPIVPPGTTPDDFVVVHSAPDTARASLVKAVLEENGIPAIVSDENLDETIGSVATIWTEGVNVLVPAARKKDAQSLLEAVRHAGASRAADDEDGDAD